MVGMVGYHGIRDPDEGYSFDLMLNPRSNFDDNHFSLGQDVEYYYVYSQGTVTAAGSNTFTSWGTTNTIRIDLKLVAGWNIVAMNYSRENYCTIEFVSKAPPANVKWVMH